MNGGESRHSFGRVVNARPLLAEAGGDVELAYAITCHKSEGSSAHAVSVTVEKFDLVTREWLYPTITRGRAMILLVVDEITLAEASERRTVHTSGFALISLE